MPLHAFEEVARDPVPTAIVAQVVWSFAADEGAAPASLCTLKSEGRVRANQAWARTNMRGPNLTAPWAAFNLTATHRALVLRTSRVVLRLWPSALACLRESGTLIGRARLGREPLFELPDCVPWLGGPSSSASARLVSCHRGTILLLMAAADLETIPELPGPPVLGGFVALAAPWLAALLHNHDFGVGSGGLGQLALVRTTIPAAHGTVRL